MARGARRRVTLRRRGGFTLAELLVTVVVITIMAGVSLPFLVPRYQEYQLRGAAWQVAGDLRLARQRAVTTRARYRFAFATSAAGTAPDTYVLEYRADQGGVETWVQELPAEPGGRVRLPGGVRIDPGTTPANGGAAGTGFITFNPNGSVVPTGSILLVNGRGTVNVVVDQVGRVQVNRT